MISALNFKAYNKGAIRGFFDFRYHGLVVKGCRLMDTGNGYWVALPSKPIEQDGETKYLDIVELTKSESEHVRRLVITDLEVQGHITHESKPATRHPSSRPTKRTPEGEDVSQYYSNPADDDDDIPF